MNASISIKKLTRYETRVDGASMTLIGEDDKGRSLRLIFSTTLLSSLIMTLPRMVSAAVRQQRNDPSARVVYPLAASKVELSTDLSTRILTLTTSDGFAVSFAVTDEQFQNLRQSEGEFADSRTLWAN